MNRSVLAIVVAATVVLSGCAALPGGGDATTEPSDVGGEQVAVEDAQAGASGVNNTLRIAVDESTNGTELAAIGATYPRENFTVDSATHDAVVVGVDTNADGEIDERFDASVVSGVNNNAYSFDVTLDTDYALESGDVVVVTYPAVENPSEAGEYEVEVRLNDQQTATGNVTIE